MVNKKKYDRHKNDWISRISRIRSVTCNVDFRIIHISKVFFDTQCSCYTFLGGLSNFGNNFFIFFVTPELDNIEFYKNRGRVSLNDEGYLDFEEKKRIFNTFFDPTMFFLRWSRKNFTEKCFKLLLWSKSVYIYVKLVKAI